MKRLIITGDSHSVALGRGLSELVRNGERLPIPVSAMKLYSSPLSLKPFFAFHGDRITFENAPLKTALHKLIGADEFRPTADGLVFALTMGFTTTKFIRSKDWRTYSPWQVAGRSKTQYLSERLIAELAAHHQRYVLDFYTALKHLEIDVLAVESPPVRVDDLAISTGTDAEVVYHVDRIARAATRRALSDRGVAIVSAPDEARDEAGFLKNTFANVKADDFHHANGAYGQIMVRRIVDSAIHQFADRVPN